MAKKKDSKLDALKNMNAEYINLKKVVETQKKEVQKYVNEIEMQKNLLEVYEKNLKVATDPIDITYYKDEIKFTKDNIKQLGQKKAKINGPLWDAKNKINEMVDLVKQDSEMSQYFKSVASRKNEQMKKTLTDRNQEIVGKKANLTKMSDLVNRFPDMGDKLMNMVQAREDLENTELNGVKYNELKKRQKTLQEKIIKDTQKGKINNNDMKDLNEITNKIKNAEKTYNDKLKDFMVDINKINHNSEEKISQKSIEQALGDLAGEKRTTASGKKIPALKVKEQLYSSENIKNSIKKLLKTRNNLIN